MRPYLLLVPSLLFVAAQAACLELPDPPKVVDAGPEVDTPDADAPTPETDTADAPTTDADADAEADQDADRDADAGPETVEGCQDDEDCEPPGPCQQEGTCDPGTGVCTYPPEPDGTACDDEDPCTLDDACDAGTCVGTAKDCDDGVACTADTCLPNGTCLNDTAGCDCVKDADCDDEDPCTGEESCQDFKCVSGTAVDCSHLDEACIEGVCNPSNGECTTSLKPLDTPCDDGDPCTLEDACDEGDCEGTPNPCDDGDPCTADSCEADTGECLHDPLEDGTPCDDGDPCTTADSCNDGACLALEAVGWTGGWQSGIDGLGGVGATVMADSASQFSTYVAFDFDNEVALAPDSDVQVFSPSGGSDAALVRHGPDGEIDWTRQFGTPEDEGVQHVVALSDGSVVVTLEHGPGLALPGSQATMDIETNGPSMVRYDSDGEPAWSVALGALEPHGAFIYPDVGFGVVACTGQSVDIADATGELGATIPAPATGWLDCHLLRWSMAGTLLAEPRLLLSTNGQLDGVTLDSGAQQQFLSTQVVLGWTLDGDARIQGQETEHEHGSSANRFVAITKLDQVGNLMWGAFVDGPDDVEVGRVAHARLTGAVVTTITGTSVMEMTSLDGVVLDSFEPVQPPTPELDASCFLQVDTDTSKVDFATCDSPGPLLPIGVQANGEVTRLVGSYSDRFASSEGALYTMSVPGVAYLLAADELGSLSEAKVEPVSPTLVGHWKMLSAARLLGVTIGGELSGNTFTPDGVVRVRSLELAPVAGCDSTP
ncbi:MAG: hypothetical protein ACQEXJ_13750 [Myxococcota bacterium]